jgi:hypothetical protein
VVEGEGKGGEREEVGGSVRYDDMKGTDNLLVKSTKLPSVRTFAIGLPRWFPLPPLIRTPDSPGYILS